MSQPALKRRGAELAHAAEPEARMLAPAPAPAQDVPEDAATREAQRLAELAACYCLFGLRIDYSACAEPEWRQSAERAYRLAQGAPEAPANDAAPQAQRRLPELPQRAPHIEPRHAIRLIEVVDWIMLTLAAQVAALWGAGAGLFQLSLGQAAPFVLGALSLNAGLWLTETYRITPRDIRPERGVGGLALGAILGVIVSNFLAPDARSAAALAATLPVAAMLLALMHAALAVWIAAAHRKGVFAETVVLVGATDAARRLVTRAAKSGEARIVAIVDDRLSRAPRKLGGKPVGGNLDDLLAWESLPHVDRIIVTVTQKAEPRVREIIARLRPLPNRVDLLLDYDAKSARGARVQCFDGAAVACVSGRPHSARRAIVKRAQDLIIGAALLTVAALPMLIIATAIKLDSKGPAFCARRRYGLNNRIIIVRQFRTMMHDAAAPRITRVGEFLQRSGLHALPQLLNVLRGEMSLVGPQPHAIGMKASECDLEHIVADYAHRHRVKPGVTGWAQVNGSRGPIMTQAAARRRLKFDLEYVSRASLWLDLQILARTALALLSNLRRSGRLRLTN